MHWIRAHLRKRMVSVLLMISPTTLAATSPLDVPRFELGIGAGWPLGVGLLIGYWGGKDLPLFARLGQGIGTTLDLGIEIRPAREGSTSVYAGVSAAAWGYFGLYHQVILDIGPTIGVRVGELFAQAGPCFYYGTQSPLGSSFGVQGQLGYSVFF